MSDQLILATEHVPLKSRIWVSIADASCAMLNTFVVSIGLTYYFTSYRGMYPGLASTVWLLFAIWNAVNDPLFGFISDRTKNKLGRRILRSARRPIIDWLLSSRGQSGGVNASQTVLFVQICSCYSSSTRYIPPCDSIYVMPLEWQFPTRRAAYLYLEADLLVFPRFLPLGWGHQRPEPAECLHFSVDHDRFWRRDGGLDLCVHLFL